MKNSLLVSTAAAALMLVSAQAEAAGRWPNWYVGLHGSLDYISDSTIKDNPVVDSYTSDNGIGYGASIGYRPATDANIIRNMRFEVEWNQQTSDMKEVDSIAGAFSGDGQTRVSAFMGNVYYDFVSLDQFQQPKTLVPYIGAGLGYASFVMDDSGTSFGNVTDKDNVLAYQGMAGVSYAPAFMPFTEWTLGYRYFATKSASFAYIAGGNFDVEYSSHNIEGGVRFLF